MRISWLFSDVGGGLCTYTRARVRASGSVGLSFLFRKQNKVGSDTLTGLENKTRSVMFRKLNKGLSVGRFVFWLKNGQRLFSVGFLFYLI